ncbi:hypothetical protein [Streptomyces sp. NPDC052042]|uniref:hypothetical protein n=1 Tax=Streptomyces sp. NPDC052042 TaxID=3365683 RepID=UPI0037D2B43B
MFSSSLSRKPAALVRTVAATGLVLAAFTFGAGTASAATVPVERTASSQAETVGGLPAYVVQRVCTEAEAIVAQLPLTSAPVQVCKLVNGWD